jgi:hypothetical protein
MARKPVAAMMVEEARRDSSSILVVCDDGSVWVSTDLTGDWQERKPVPGTARHNETDAGVQAERDKEAQKELTATAKRAAEQRDRQRKR